MKIAATLTNPASIQPLVDAGCDIFIVGIDHLSHRMNKTFSLEEFIPLAETIKAHHKQVYVNLNRIVHDEDLNALSTAMAVMKERDIEGILFTDLAVFMLAEKVQLTDRLIYAPETYSTHSYDLAFWQAEKIKGIVLSREVTLTDIETIAQDSPLPIYFYGHGYLNMFHSRRPLIENFFKHTNDRNPEAMIDRRNLTIVEEIRDAHYPIYQDEYGTHIFRDKPRESFTVFEQLKKALDVLIIDSVLIEEEAFIQAVADYRSGLDKPLDNAIIARYHRQYDQGFYFKKTQSTKGDT